MTWGWDTTKAKWGLLPPHSKSQSFVFHLYHSHLSTFSTCYSCYCNYYNISRTRVDEGKCVLPLRQVKPVNFSLTVLWGKRFLPSSTFMSSQTPVISVTVIERGKTVYHPSHQEKRAWPIWFFLLLDIDCCGITRILENVSFILFLWLHVILWVGSSLVTSARIYNPSLVVLSWG